ncbi:hypothetical protein [Borreliella burgdorferi]|uniref:hypothetical protein n=1 Tax=Borreliella burgdorferi TaxID=139 RepID=UPI00016B2F1C|nr:hypothetical protein [Borreliella burgdorferi]ACL34241.1 hypothetical protein Bbu156a_W37 [Borreliella burgdorferi 156a]ACM10477.1 hypothetical protein BBU72A_P0038 [Borreliella burgdorferi 72a]MCD2375698.1 hypothetical protein [Borreliella burgdorferi]MDK7384169.1 hypothetical protein [Borreliella burgdorferi]PRQ93196.1 hypothetical protein CV682_06185 [Borreliella burgdorferi]
MNKKMKMFIICAVFALMISCKNYASGEDVKSLEQEKDLKEKIKGFLETKKEEFFGDFEKPVVEVKPKDEESMQADEPKGHDEEQVAQKDLEDSKLKEIEKQIRELKEKIEKSDGKTPIGKYCEYEGKIKELKEELKDKEKLKNKLEELEKTLKERIEKRKKELEDAQSKFKEFEKQVKNASGVTYGQKVKGKGSIGFQAWIKAKELGVNGSHSANDGTNTDDFSNKVIDDALKNINEELKKLNNKEE